MHTFVFKCVYNVLPDNWNCTFTHIKLQGSLLIYDHIFVSGNHVSFQLKLLVQLSRINSQVNQVKMAKSLYSFKILLKHELLKCPYV